MRYFGIKNKKTGELIRQFCRQNSKDNIYVLSFDNVPDTLCCHIFLTKNKDTAASLLRDGYCEDNGEAYKLDAALDIAKEDLEIYESEFNL